MHGTEEKMKNFNMMKKLLALTLGAAMLLALRLVRRLLPKVSAS